MSERLYLNGELVDMISKPITRKIQIGEIGDVSSRKSSYSYSHNLPRTSRNTRIFDMLGVSGNTSRKPYENIVANYVVDGITLVSNGYVVIDSTGEYFEINIYNGIIDLTERLKGLKLSDLELSDFDHVLTSQGYIDSFSNTEGYIYCIGNFGLGVSSAIKVEEQAPCLYLHTIFQRIFEVAGVNLVGGFFTNNPNYKTEVVTPSKGYTVVDEDFTEESKGSVNTNTLSGFGTSDSPIEENKKFNLSSVGLVGASISNNDILFSVAGRYRLNIVITHSSINTFLNFRAYRNGEVIAYKNLSEGQSPESKSITITVDSGDRISFRVIAVAMTPEEGGSQKYHLSYSISANMNLLLLTGGQLIRVSDYIGDMNQIDFVKDVLHRYGLQLHPIQNSNDYRFRQIEANLSDRDTAEDWTSKYVDQPKENYISNYAQSNIAKYQYTEEIVIPNNDGSFTIDNSNAKAEDTLFTSPFEIPIARGVIGGNDTYLIPIRELDDGVIENTETPLKVMRIKRVDTPISAVLFGEEAPPTADTNIPFLSLENMSMQFFISNYYKAFQSLINSYKQIDILLNLSVIDVYNLDFFKLKYLKQTGRYYYLDSVQHTPNKHSKVTMNEILEFPTNQPPSEIGNYSFNMNHGATKVITVENILTGYVDLELDPPLKVKIIDGFNSDLVMYQNGVELTEETEILLDNLDLEVKDILGGAAGYQKTWSFTIADKGSGQYSSDTGNITGNVIELPNDTPVANAGSNQVKSIDSWSGDLEVQINLDGSQSTDNIGGIVSWQWTVISAPSGSSPSVNQSTNNPWATLFLPNDFSSVGVYTLQLLVIDEYLASDTDTMTVTIQN